MKRKFSTVIICYVLTLIIAALPFLGACGEDAPEKDKIVIGAARPLSGPLAQIGDFAFGPVMTLWAEEVNARGGIDVAGKKMPVELKVYDDTVI